MGIAPRVIAKIMKAKLSPCMRSNIEGFGIAICLQDCKSVALFIVVTIQPLGQTGAQLASWVPNCPPSSEQPSAGGCAR
jgi:hypothetical protein